MGWNDLLTGVPALVWAGCASCGGVIKKILAYLGLATEAPTNPEETIWLPKKSTLRGPPEEVFPPDLDHAGLPEVLDAVDEDLSEPFLYELPAQDLAE